MTPAEAIRALMRHVLFFAYEPALVQQIYHALCVFVDRVPVRRLTVAPDRSVWELLG
jgi:hypothetical protein